MAGVLLTAAFLGGNQTAGETAPVAASKPITRLLENESIQSKALNRSVSYEVLLPENYDASKESYPVVYLLHGYGDDQTAWSGREGRIQWYADYYASEIVPMIFVMPQGFESYYVNKYDGTFPYMDFFTTELVPEIDARYRTKKDKTQRAVMGYSMGGFGAIVLPLLNPTLLGVGVPLSISMRTDDQYMTEQPQSEWDHQWGRNFGGVGLSGAARLTDYYKAHHPLHLLNQTDLSPYAGLRFFLDCGDDEEQLDIPNGALHNLMMAKRIPHEYRVRNGGHSWGYWHGALPEALVFLSHGFQGMSDNSEPDPASTGPLIATEEYRRSTISGIQVGVFKPAPDGITNGYPVIYFVHDYLGYDRATNAVNIISILHKNMVAGRIPNSMVVEIPQSSLLTATVLTNIINKIEGYHRTVGNKGGRVLMGNGLGGAAVCSLIADFVSVFNGCFLYDAQLAASAVYPAFYYVDLPDKSTNYASNYNLYRALKSRGSRREYRIRPGTSSPQSNLNGLEGSMIYLDAALSRDLAKNF